MQNTKALSFVTITMRDPAERDTRPADLLGHVVDKRTALLTTFKFDFQADPRLGKDDFPIAIEAAESLVKRNAEDMMMEWIREQPESDYETHLEGDGVMNKIIAAARKRNDISLLPDPIVTALGTIKFMPEPTKETFIDLASLPTLLLPAIRAGSAEVVTLYLQLTGAEQSPTLTNNGMGWGAAKNGSVDMDALRKLISQQLDNALSAYGLEIIMPGYPSPRFGSMGHQPHPQEPTHYAKVLMAYDEFANELIRNFPHPDRPRESVDFTLTKGGHSMHNRVEAGELTLSINIGGDFVMSVVGPQNPQGRQVQHYSAGRPGMITGTVTFAGSERAFSIANHAHSRHGATFDLTMLMDPEEVKFLVGKAVDYHLAPLGLDHLVNVDSIEFDGDATQ